MRTRTYLITGGVTLLIAVFFIGRCTAPNDKTKASALPLQPSALAYTCSMHPQIQRSGPGDCPICGMDLIPLDKEAGSESGPRTLNMSESSKALADIQTSRIERRFPEAEVRLVGELDYDETKVRSLTARFPARIDTLFVNFNGVPVKQGDHLARVYSPELLTAQSELLAAYRFNPNSSATESAKEKLRLWDLLPEQIEAILQSGEAKDHFELKAPISGVVVHKNVNEGDYIKTGQPLFKIVDLNTLWLRLDAYESDLAWLRFGQTVTFKVEAYPGRTFHGQVTFIEPELNRKTRTVSVRVNVSNEANTLKPGMFAKAVVRSQVAHAGQVYAPEFAGKWISPMHPEIVKDESGECDICGMDLVPAEELGYVQDPNTEPPLVVPASAVLRTGKRAVVYIEKPNTDLPAFEGREIEIGPRAGDVFIVIAGLNEGDRVVTKGAFKIDSALQIQAKPSMMNPDGGGPSPGHNHGASESTHDHSQHEAPASIDLDTETAKKTLPHYFELQSALAGDNLAAAKAALEDITSGVGHNDPIAELIHIMQAAHSLDAMRRPHFETLSKALLKVINEDPESFHGDLYQISCPMVYPNRGADWLQNHSDLRNPYFGAQMLHCGEIKTKY